MGRLRRSAAPVVLLLAVACTDPGPVPGSDRVLSAAGTASAEAPPPVPAPTSTTTAVTVTAPPPTTKVGVAPSTVRRTATTRAPATGTPPIAGYSPAPPPPGVDADGYGGYGGVTDTRSAGPH